MKARTRMTGLVTGLVLALVTLASCTGTDFPSKTEKSSKPTTSKPAITSTTEQYGNGSVNIQGGLGEIACTQDTVAFFNVGLYRWKKGDKKPTKLTDRGGQWLNVDGDRLIWYDTEDGALYTIGVDGTGEKKLVTGDFMSPLRVGEWIYYTTNHGALWRMRTNGTQMQKLCDDEVGWYHVTNDTIYFISYGNSDYTEPRGIDRMNADGIGRNRLLASACYTLVGDGDWLYYTTSSIGTKGPLRRISMDGKKDEPVLDAVTAYCVIDGVIYYTDPTDDDKLYRIDADQKNKQLLCDQRTSDVRNSGKMVWHGHSAHAGSLYIIQPDGKELSLEELVNGR